MANSLTLTSGPRKKGRRHGRWLRKPVEAGLATAPKKGYAKSTTIISNGLTPESLVGRSQPGGLSDPAGRPSFSAGGPARVFDRAAGFGRRSRPTFPDCLREIIDLAGVLAFLLSFPLLESRNRTKLGQEVGRPARSREPLLRTRRTEIVLRVTDHGCAD